MYKKNPETSIIIRTFNEGKHIGNLLEAIKKQDYKDWEVVLVDSGSTDNTLEIAKDLGCKSVVKIESCNFTFGYSLNIGCKKARGKYLVFVSAHVVPQGNQWLGNLLAPFRDKKVAFVYGRQIGCDDSRFSEKRDFKRIFNEKCGYPNNANSAIRKELWEKHYFDEYLFGLEDVEWAGRMKERGFTSYYEPNAVVLHIHNEKWAQVFNRYRREAIAAARIGLPAPPQVKPGFFWIAGILLNDLLASLPNITPSRLEEIMRFRYYQWKGTRRGWIKDRELDINRDKYSLFYPAVNRAVVIKNKHLAILEEMPLPEIKPGDILILVAYVGVCRTDVEVYDGTLGYYKTGQAKYPIIPGHEFSGTIVRIGANNKYRERFKVGEKVVGECILSRSSDVKRREVGVINFNGAYSQFVVMPGEYIHKIPDAIDLKIACLTEPLAVVLRGLKRIANHIKENDTFAVVGAGPIGNLCAQVLLNSGHKVSVFDKNNVRLKFFKSRAQSMGQSLKNLKDFNIIIEATGSAKALEKVIHSSRKDGTILLLGFPYGNIQYNFEDLVSQEKVIIGSVGGSNAEFKSALELLPAIDTSVFLEKISPLEEYKKAWDLQRSSKYLKIILKP